MSSRQKRQHRDTALVTIQTPTGTISPSAMKKISRVASFKTRKNIANGIFISKLIYLMPVWIGCDDYLTNHCRSARTRLLAVIDKMA